MDVLNLVAYYLALGVTWTWRLSGVVAVGLGAWALVDALLRPAGLFPAAGKRSKGFWIGVNAIGVAVVLVTGFASMLGLLGVVVNAVYLADVRPALRALAPVKVRSRMRVVRDDGPDDRYGWRR